MDTCLVGLSGGVEPQIAASGNTLVGDLSDGHRASFGDTISSAAGMGHGGRRIDRGREKDWFSMAWRSAEGVCSVALGFRACLLRGPRYGEIQIQLSSSERTGLFEMFSGHLISVAIL